MNRKSLLVIGGLAAAMPCLMFSCLAAFTAIVGPPKKSTEAEAAEAKSKAEVDAQVELWDAWAAMQKFVEQRLRTPGTVKWPDEGFWNGRAPEEFTSRVGEGEYKVTAWFDAQNGFGALIRTEFDGRVRKVPGDKWELLELHLQPR